MLLIIAHHFVVNSGLTAADGPIYSDPLSWRSVFLLLFGAWGKTGINCFVLITGYFMCTSHITAKKFAKLFLEWMFYRYVIHCIFIATGYETITLKNLILWIVPITQISTGFTPCFIIFYLFIPMLNILIHNLNEKQHLLLLLLCAFTYVFLGTFHRVTMNYVSWFIVLFLIASYIRLYPKPCFNHTGLWGWLTLAAVLVSALSVVSAAWLGEKLERNMAFYFVTDSNTFLAVATGICSFMFFKNLRMPNSKLINTIAASTFGVLLIHAHSDAMRQWLWKDVLDNVRHYADRHLPLRAIVCVLAIFTACVCIDYLRIRFIERPIFRVVIDPVLEKLRNTEKRLSNLLGLEKD